MPSEELFNKIHFGQDGQVLAPDNISANIGEAQEARVKDPLWFLARQWQSGEFEAENGGRVAHTEVNWSSQSVSRIDLGDGFSAVDAAVPLDVIAEAEDEDGLSAAWNSAAQEYRFRLCIDNPTANTTLVADDYHGKKLDWYQFDVDELGADEQENGETRSSRIVPTQLAFKGMPHARWWRFEDAQVRLEANTDPEPNALSMLLPEFLVIDANNWLLVPVEQPVGGLRKINSLKVIDSFGVVTEIDPGCGPDDSWQSFTLDREDSESHLSGAYLFTPNIATEAVQGEIIEDIALLRDEDANTVWGVEHWYWDQENDERVFRGDKRDRHSADNSEVSAPAAGLSYKLKSDIAENWIPYIPKLVDPEAEDGQTYLRRARSVESANQDNPQYRTRLLSEAWKLNEEEIPLRGLKVQRLYRFARDYEGNAHIWVARRKDVAPQDNWPGLEFDYLEDA